MKTSKLLYSIIGFFLVLTMGSSLAMAAEEFPTRYVTIMCGNSAGGSTDVQIRGIIPYLQKHLGKGIVVENLTGASGILCYNKVYSSSPDGYTLMVDSLPGHILLEKYFVDNAKYVTKESTHIYGFANDDLILVGNPDLYKSFQDFIQASKQRKLKIGVGGKGYPTHLAMVTLERAAKIETNIVPYEGGAEALAALAGKHLDAVSTLVSSVYSLIKSGMVGPLLILGDRRRPAFPDTPCAKEVGLNLSIPYVIGVWGPPRIPAGRVKILETAFAKAVDDPDYVKWAKNMNIEIARLSSADFLNESIKDYTLVEDYIKTLTK